METVTSIPGLRRQLAAVRARGKRIALVPTMGNLHAGHLELVRQARRQAEHVVVSIFVNPAQFGPQEDYDNYPHTPERDRDALLETGADLLFLPEVEEIYPQGPGDTTVVEVPGLNRILEGAHRPTHFNGVTTVVAKLFNLVQPDVAVFGEKDYQQLLLIRRMVADLCMPVTIVGVATVREMDGLAMSSRNGYLDPVERALAPRLHAVLAEVKARVEAGGQDLAAIEQDALAQLAAAGFQPDYVDVRRCSDLTPPAPGDTDLIALAAARLGPARLIDNIFISIS
ncbi:MAG TPA: pantoate--beta-alanine ligase [Gammaproteobacteria bacterium]|nr:pantoate--beta-alanine ligase [Gammaproteobacteria bacterium]